MTYKDVSGATASSVYDRYGQPKTYTEKDAAGSTIGTRTFTYDRNLDPRGYLTSIADSVAGTISATYGADGQVLTETLPGGVALTLGYDATRTPTSRTYTYNNQVVASSTVTTNTAGKWATHNTTASSSTYVYDALGRLTGAQQSINGTCTWRQYDFNARSDRTAKRTKTIAGGCPTITGSMGTPTQTIGYTYDSADRLVSDTSGSSQPWAYDGLGRMTAYRSALNPNTTVSAVYYDNDRIKSQTTPDGVSIAWTLDPIGRFNTITTTPAGGGTATVKQNHYTDDSDSPAWIAENTGDPNAITRYVDGIDGQLAYATGKTGGRILQLVDLHGDIMGTLPIADGTNGTATIGSLVLRANDEYGIPLNLSTGGVSANAPPRYGYLGGEQRSAETLGGTLLMGSRVYQPAIGRFTSLDSEPGGNASDYDYVHSDPVNNTDLTGNWPDWKSVLGTVAKVAEIGSMIPGPVGTAFAIAGAGAYALRGDAKSALRMGLTAAANMVGCGMAVKVGFKLAGRAGGLGRIASNGAKAVRSMAAKAAAAFKRPAKMCSNSFTADTPVLMGDGTQIPIAAIDHGDYVWATDPLTGEAGPREVINLINHDGLHLMVDLTFNDGTTLTATDRHPVWETRSGTWVDAIDLKPGDTLIGPEGDEVPVARVVTRTEYLAAYNLTVDDLHTYYAGATPSLTHNMKCRPTLAQNFIALSKTLKTRVAAEAKARLDAVRKRGCFRGLCASRDHYHVDYKNGKGEIKATIHYRWRPGNGKKKGRRMSGSRKRGMGPTKIRLLAWSIRDEHGQSWDRLPGWLRPGEAQIQVKRAERVLVHDEAFRSVRSCRDEELEDLLGRLDENAGSGDVVASVYRSGASTLVMLAVRDR